MCVIVIGTFIFQPGGRGTNRDKVMQMPKKALASGQEVYKSWQVVIVSKTSYW